MATAQIKNNNPGRRRLRTAMAIVMTACLTISVGAWADWAVNDSEAIDELKAIHKSIGDPNSDDLLTYQKNQSNVTKGDLSPDAQKGEQQGRYKDPDVMFKSTDVTLTANASAKLSSVDMSDETRCPKPKKPDAPKVDGIDTGSAISSASSTAGDGIPDQQYKLCKDILETQKAQFKYNVMMSELADVRYQRLQQIERDRGNIDELAAGKLQDNTNRMLALIALIQIDQQQQKTYNDAYSARVTYLRGVQDRLSQMALNGTSGTDSSGGGPLGGVGGQLANDAATMAVMTLALGDNSPLHSKQRGQ
ncbi:hypothetical protein [Solilutibacter silvestris]|uniref:Uncharacterized protein n=1 Tax=Solilutibacter silvestris TaxID=1645665 RepID=A0A2K1PYT5_9GAMM|nr:hypothetical protein [Lysobacter silvestris]PNS07930.1 hypothetical protein Lysil_2106 [Lysobacter silvestris]